MLKQKFFVLFSLLISLLFSAIVIVLLPDIFSKFELKVIRQGTVDKRNGIAHYEDLYSEGHSYQIMSFENTEGNAGLKIMDQQNRIVDQWNFPGRLIHRGIRLICGDYDHSGIKKIMVFTQNRDSLLLNCLEPGNSEKISKVKFITKLNVHNGQYDYEITSLLFADLNRDGQNEIIFNVMTGFALQPRKIYAYDFTRDTLICTPLTGSVLQVIDVFDINHDGFPEVFCNSKAPMNYPDPGSIPFSDHSAWLMVFDHNLRLLFEPVEHPGFTSNVYALPFNDHGRGMIVSVFESNKAGSKPKKTSLYDIKGNLLKSRIDSTYPETENYDLVTLGSDRSQLFIFNSNGYVRKLDTNLNPVNTIHIEHLKGTRPVFMNIDNDTLDELITYHPYGNRLLILRNNLEDPAGIELPLTIQALEDLSVKNISHHATCLYLQSGIHWVEIQYEKNKFHYLKYPAYLLIFLIVLSLILVLNKIQNSILKQRYEVRKRITELQLLALNNQIDPHFTFNVLTSVNSYVVQEKPDLAGRQIVLLSGLIRNYLESSDKICRTILEEMEFLNLYLGIEKSRNEDLFNFSIVISPEVNTMWKVPKMVIQIFVENSLKHGIRPKGKGGVLEISVQSSDKMMVIDIKDNGIGRKPAQARNGDSTRRGMKIVGQMFSLLNQYNREKLSYRITDLSDRDQNPCGTEVQLLIPKNLNCIFHA